VTAGDRPIWVFRTRSRFLSKVFSNSHLASAAGESAGRGVLMLKIWKQAWKKGDSACHAHPGQNSGAQDAPLSGASSGSSPMISAAAVPPIKVDDILGPILPRGRRGTIKRTRANDAEELSANFDTDRPRKKTKFQDEETYLVNDTLGNHLPEVIEASGAVRPETPPLRRATFEEELFEHAKAENSEFCKYNLRRLIFK